MTSFSTYCFLSCFLFVFHLEIASSKSVLGAAIATSVGQLTNDSPPVSIGPSRQNSVSSSEKTIRKTSKQEDEDNVATPLQNVVNSLFVPGAQYAAASILKAVSSPFEFFSKSVSDIVNPTSEKPAQVTQKIVAASASNNGQPQQPQSSVTYLVIPPEQGGAQSGSANRVVSPTVSAPPQQTTTSGEEDEEDEEEIED